MSMKIQTNLLIDFIKTREEEGMRINKNKMKMTVITGDTKQEIFIFKINFEMKYFHRNYFFL